jgi:hypothetical protein
VRVAHPDQWLVVEALDAHSENDQRVVDRVAVIDVCPDGRTSMKRYAELRRDASTSRVLFRAYEPGRTEDRSTAKSRPRPIDLGKLTIDFA